MGSNKDIFWVRTDPFKNSVSLYAKTMTQHISKHEMDEHPTTEEHIFQAVTNPDHARRSLDPIVGNEACVFEKYFPSEGERFFTFVLYDDVTTPADYEAGGKKGHVMSGYFPGRPENSKHIGEIFWSKPVTVESPIEAREAIAASEEQDDRGEEGK